MVGGLADGQGEGGNSSPHAEEFRPGEISRAPAY